MCSVVQNTFKELHIKYIFFRIHIFIEIRVCKIINGFLKVRWIFNFVMILFYRKKEIQKI